MRSHLASFVDDFRRHAAETAIVSHRGVRSYRTTYGELAELAGRFSSELERRSIGPGDRVLLWGENSAEWVAAFFGCLLRGVLAVPLDAAGSPAFVARIVGEVTPRLIVADTARLRLLVADTPTLSLSELREVLPIEPDFLVDPAVQEDAPFQIIFTSGTTSEPKGIVHTHRNVLASLRPIEAEIDKYRRYERWFHPLRFLHTLPLSHVFGQFMGLWIPGLLAAEVHFSDVVESGRVVQLIHRERISVLVAVPRILALLRAHLLGLQSALVGRSLQDEIDRAAGMSIQRRWWRFRAVHRAFGWKFWAVISGGAALPAELEVFWNRLGFALIQGYGMTETAALVTLNHPFHIGRGTIGKVLPGREVRVSDTGELLVRGDVVAGATWQGGRLQQRSGEWLETGDIAEQNESGEFRFLGRKGDTIVSSSGMNIHPADLEAAMLRQPGVQACAVVPCDLSSGPEPVCVVPFQGDDAAMQKAVDDANRELADFQQMRRALRWPEITFPYTSTGKLLRRKIREWACGRVRGEDGEGAQTEDFLLATIASITGASITGEAAAVNGGDDLRLSEDLHLDSLGRVQLASVLEQRTGVMIDDAQIASLTTLGALRRAAGAGASIPMSQGAAEEMRSPVSRSNVCESNADVAAMEVDIRSAVTVYPHWPWWAPLRLLRGVFIEAVLRPLIGVLLTPRIIAPGITALPNGPMLIIANHVTALDGALVLYALPAALRRRVAVMMSGEMLGDFRSGQRYGVAGRAAYWLLTALFNVFPLPRLQGFRQSFAHAGEALDRGYSVLIFPEGTRSRTGEIAAFRPGIGLLAAHAGVPVLPVALIGLERTRVRGARWFRSGSLEIRVGSPVNWKESMPATDWTAELEEELRTLYAGWKSGSTSD
jgi:long-chain acyl-CoA synthetase